MLYASRYQIQSCNIWGCRPAPCATISVSRTVVVDDDDVLLSEALDESTMNLPSDGTTVQKRDMKN
jgi:hypothetical protein